MRKICLLIVIAVVLVACGQQQSDQNSTKETKQSVLAQKQSSVQAKPTNSNCRRYRQALIFYQATTNHLYHVVMDELERKEINCRVIHDFPAGEIRQHVICTKIHSQLNPMSTTIISHEKKISIAYHLLGTSNFRWFRFISKDGNKLTGLEGVYLANDHVTTFKCSTAPSGCIYAVDSSGLTCTTGFSTLEFSDVYNKLKKLTKNELREGKK